MKLYTTLTEAYNELRDWFIDNASSLSESEREIFGSVFRLGSSPVDAIVHSAELIYARRSQFGEEAKAIAAGLFRFASMYGFHRLGDDGRGEQAAAILDGGDDSEAPAPLTRFALPLAPPAPTGV